MTIFALVFVEKEEMRIMTEGIVQLLYLNDRYNYYVLF